MNDPKLVRMQEKGQVTIPQEIRKKLGLKRGDLVAVMETPEGVFIKPQQVVATKALDSMAISSRNKVSPLKRCLSQDGKSALLFCKNNNGCVLERADTSQANHKVPRKTISVILIAEYAIILVAVR